MIQGIAEILNHKSNDINVPLRHPPTAGRDQHPEPVRVLKARE